MIKMICDKCGKETNKFYTFKLFEKGDPVPVSNIEMEKLDLCLDCATRMIREICEVDPVAK